MGMSFMRVSNTEKHIPIATAILIYSTPQARVPALSFILMFKPEGYIL